MSLFWPFPSDFLIVLSPIPALSNLLPCLRVMLLRQRRNKVCETNPGLRKNWLGEGLTIKSRWTMPCPLLLRPGTGLLTQYPTHCFVWSHFNWETFVHDNKMRSFECRIRAAKCVHSSVRGTFGSPLSRLLACPTQNIYMHSLVVPSWAGQCSGGQNHNLTKRTGCHQRS